MKFGTYMRAHGGVGLAVVVLTALTLLQPTCAEPVSDLVLKPGVYRTHWVAEAGGVELPVRWLEKSTWNSVKKPNFISDDPLFRVGRIGSMLFATDESRGTDTGLDTLYLDVNGNNDLTDDQPILGSVSGKVTRAFWEQKEPSGGMMPTESTKFPSLRVSVKDICADSTNTKIGLLDIEMSRGDSSQSCKVIFKGCWAGEIDSSKGRIPFKLLDGNWNGKYDDLQSWDLEPAASGIKGTGGDSIEFDWSDTRGSQGTESRKLDLSKTLNIGGKLYELKPRSDGRCMEVSPYSGPQGIFEFRPLQPKGSQVEVSHVVVRGLHSVFDLQGDRTLTDVQTGPYLMHWAELKATDENGTHWNLIYYWKPFSVSAGKTTTIDLGGDITMEFALGPEQLAVKKDGDDVTPVTLHLSAGGDVWELRREKNLVRAAVAIKDSAGTILMSEKASSHSQTPSGEYHLNCRWIQGPTDLGPGTYTLEATYDAGPFGGVIRASKIVTIP
jgi:hypothetical protein